MRFALLAARSSHSQSVLLLICVRESSLCACVTCCGQKQFIASSYHPRTIDRTASQAASHYSNTGCFWLGWQAACKCVSWSCMCAFVKVCTFLTHTTRDDWHMNGTPTTEDTLACTLHSTTILLYYILYIAFQESMKYYERSVQKVLDLGA